jgi:Transcriptional regulators
MKKYTDNNTNSDDQESEVFDNFARLAVLMHRYGHYTRRERGLFGDMSRGQGRVLSLLKMQPEITQKDLSYLLDMRPQSLGELLSKLEKKGFITRTPSEDDRRIMLIRLTPEGEKAAESPKNKSDDFFGILNPEEKEQFNDYLERLIKNLEEKMDKSDSDSRKYGFFNRFGKKGPSPCSFSDSDD